MDIIKKVIFYNISKSPNLKQINDMLNKAFDNRDLEGLKFHSDTFSYFVFN